MNERLNPNHHLNDPPIEEIKRCPQCQSPFEGKRSTKKYCSDKCRQYFNRTTQNAKASKAKEREQIEYYDRVNYAMELYLNCPPQDRDDWIQSYIDNPTTKKIICNPDLLKGSNDNIAKVCHRYVMRTYGVSIKSYY